MEPYWSQCGPGSLVAQAGKPLGCLGQEELTAAALVAGSPSFWITTTVPGSSRHPTVRFPRERDGFLLQPPARLSCGSRELARLFLPRSVRYCCMAWSKRGSRRRGFVKGCSRAVGCEGRPSPDQSLHWLDSPNTSVAPIAQNTLFLLRFISGQQQIIHHCKSVQGNEAISLLLAQSGLHEQILQPHRVLPRCMGTGMPSSRSFLPKGHLQVLCVLGLGS